MNSFLQKNKNKKAISAVLIIFVFSLLLVVFLFYFQEGLALSGSTCSELGWDPAATGTSDLVCGECDDSPLSGCSGGMTFTQAENFCENAGARLCTKLEMEADETKGTGCGYDNELNWTSTSCDSGYWAIQGASDRGISPSCTPSQGYRYVRCCGDKHALFCGDNDSGCPTNPYDECDFNEENCDEVYGTWDIQLGDATTGCWSGKCCGDDFGENYRYRLCNNSYACSGSSSDNACCNMPTDCVHSGCYGSGTHTHDVDGNGDAEYCSSGKWYDCYNTGDCDPIGEYAYTESNSLCTSGECHEACTFNDCIYQRYEGNGDCDNNSGCYNSNCIQDPDFDNTFVGAGMCDNNIGAICTGGGVNVADICVASGSCLIDHDYDDNMVDCAGNNCIKGNGDTFDLDNDGDLDHCNSGTWVDCNVDSDCGFCEDCSSNNCVDANSGTDPNGDCSTTDCQTGNCDGSGSCDKYTSGQRNCGECNECNTSGSCISVSTGTDPYDDCGLCGICGADGCDGWATGGTDPENECSVGAWSCSGDCIRVRNSGDCSGFGYCRFNDESDDIAQGYRCSGGSEINTGVCGYSNYACNGTCQKVRDEYRCNGSGSCNYDVGNDSDNCDPGTYCSLNSCTSGACQSPTDYGSCDYSDVCDESASKTRTIYNCSAGSCVGSNDTTGCSRDTDGDDCGTCKICSIGSCLETPIDDSACGTIDCDGLNYYYTSGTASPTGTNYCKYRNYADIISNRCEGFGICKDSSDCTSYSDSTAATCGTCKYAEGACTSCSSYDSFNDCGFCEYCVNGSCVNVSDAHTPADMDPNDDCAASSWSCNGDCQRIKNSGDCGDGTGACVIDDEIDDIDTGYVCTGIGIQTAVSTSNYCLYWENCDDGDCSATKYYNSCNGSGSCRSSGDTTNAATTTVYAQSGYSLTSTCGTTGTSYCSGTDNCSGDTRYTGYKCDDSGSCDVSAGDIGCCADSKCSAGWFCEDYVSGSTSSPDYMVCLSTEYPNLTEPHCIRQGYKYKCEPSYDIGRGNIVFAGGTNGYNSKTVGMGAPAGNNYPNDWWCHSHSGQGDFSIKTSYTTSDSDLCIGYVYDPCSNGGNILYQNADGTRSDLGDADRTTNNYSGCSWHNMWIDLSSYLGVSNGYMNISMEGNVGYCSRNIYFGYKKSETGNVTDGNNSTWCCDNSNDCVDDAPAMGGGNNDIAGTGSGCHNSGTHTHDANDDGDDDYCSNSGWLDCYDTGDCDPVDEYAYTESSDTCISGECHEACTSNDCIYQRYEGNGDCDNNDGCYNSSCIQDPDYSTFVGAGVCDDNSVGAICTGGATDESDVCVASGSCLIDHDYDDNMADCTGDNCIKSHGDPFDVDNDGDDDYCDVEEWIDCNFDSDCGLCEECVNSDCVNVGSGTDPNGDCSTTGCQTGNCDGSGACAYYTAGQHNCAECHECNSSGNCVNVTNETDCGLCKYCQTGSCVNVNGAHTPADMDPNGDCTEGSWSCDGDCQRMRDSGDCGDDTGACAVNDVSDDIDTGYICSGGIETAVSSSNYCNLDNVCSDGNCSGTKYYTSCDAAGSCRTAGDHTDSASETIYAQSGNTLTDSCGTTGTSLCSTTDYCSGDGWYTDKVCDDLGNCNVGSGVLTPCYDANCISDGDGTGTYSSCPDSTCTSGACSTTSYSSCGIYSCNNTVCYTSCTNDSHCAKGYYCLNTNCVPGRAQDQISSGSDFIINDTVTRTTLLTTGTSADPAIIGTDDSDVIIADGSSLQFSDNSYLIFKTLTLEGTGKLIFDIDKTNLSRGGAVKTGQEIKVGPLGEFNNPLGGEIACLCVKDEDGDGFWPEGDIKMTTEENEVDCSYLYDIDCPTHYILIRNATMPGDCDDDNSNIYQYRTAGTDKDNDQYVYESESAINKNEACVGISNGQPDDMIIYYKDSDGFFTKLDERFILGYEDYDDND